MHIYAYFVYFDACISYVYAYLCILFVDVAHIYAYLCIFLYAYLCIFVNIYTYLQTYLSIIYSCEDEAETNLLASLTGTIDIHLDAEPE